MDFTSLLYYGQTIGTIIIFLVFIIAIILIIDEFYKLSTFTYIYTYLYNYGKMNESICKKDNNNLIEYETARFRIYNKLPQIFFHKDLFNKSWYNYLILVATIILSILICVAFGTFFYLLFIEGNNTCNIIYDSQGTKKTINHNDYSYINMLLDCYQSNVDDINKFYISNCSFYWFTLFIIIIIYPTIYLMKFFFKLDYTDKGGVYSKLFHFIFYIILLYYIYILLTHKTFNNDDRYGIITVYIIFIIIFAISNFIFNKTFDEYYNLSNQFNIYSDANEGLINFYDIYKQKEPIKPEQPKKPEELGTFQKCTDTDIKNEANAYCNKFKDNDKDYKTIEKKVEEYYMNLKNYDKLIELYNKKHSIYKSNNIQFPKTIGIISHMLPKLLGLDKTYIQLLFILLVVIFIAYYYLKLYNKDTYANYLYYTIFIYVVGILSILVLSNAIFTYNTYLNKYIIYEPTAYYKEDFNNLNLLLTALAKKETDPAIMGNYLRLYNFINNKSTSLSYNNAATTTDYSVYITNNADPPTTQKSDADKSTYSILYSCIYTVIYSHIFKIQKLREIPDAGITKLLAIYSGTTKIIKNDETYYRTKSSAGSVETPNTLKPATDDTSTSTMSPNVRTCLIIIKNIFVENLSDINSIISKLRNNLIYYVYTTTEARTYDNANSFYNTYIQPHITSKQMETEVILTTSSTPITHYKSNLSLIDKIFEIYELFLRNFRKEVIRLLNTTDVNCDENGFVNIDVKLSQFMQKLFKTNSFKEFKDIDQVTHEYTYKDSTEEPKIDIYKKILNQTITKINLLFTQYLDAITFILNSFTTTETNNISKFDELIIKNYNFYNSAAKHINNTFVKIPITLNNKYRNTYYNYKSNDIKQMNYNINNVSLSSVIMIIIFTMILIEPSII